MKFKYLALFIIFSFVMLFGAGNVFADTPTPTGTITSGSGPAVIDTLANPAGSSNVQNLGGFVVLIRDFLFTVVGLTLAGAILYGGFVYMTSQGEPEQIKKAQSILLYSIIGVAVIALSVIIIELVAKIIGIDVSGII